MHSDLNYFGNPMMINNGIFVAPFKARVLLVIGAPLK